MNAARVVQVSWKKEVEFSSFNPLHHNISMHILHTALYTFSKVLTLLSRCVRGI